MKKLSLLLCIQIFCVCVFAQTYDHSKIKLFRFGTFESERPAVEYPDGTRLDVSNFGEDYNEKFFATDGIIRLQTWLSTNARKCSKVPLTERFGSCIARPSKIVAIGLNYVEHVKEGLEQGVAKAIPREPIIFLKSTSALLILVGAGLQRLANNQDVSYGHKYIVITTF